MKVKPVEKRFVVKSLVDDLRCTSSRGVVVSCLSDRIAVRREIRPPAQPFTRSLRVTGLVTTRQFVYHCVLDEMGSACGKTRLTVMKVKSYVYRIGKPTRMSVKSVKDYVHRKDLSCYVTVGHQWRFAFLRGGMGTMASPEFGRALRLPLLFIS